MVFPSNDSVIWQSLGSNGSLGMVPRLHCYYGLLRLPAAPPVSLVWLQEPVPPSHPVVRSWSSRCPPSRPGLFGLWRPQPRSKVETAGPPRFLGGPPANMPCSSTPTGPSGQAIATFGCCLPFYRRRRLPQSKSFEAPSHGLFARCLRFVAWVTPVLSRHARLASGCWPALPGGGGYPPGPIARFQVVYVILPPRPGLTWRTDRLFL